jgi:non-ribosomal peptide synthetase component E (peptide arylation enzyme)
LRTESSNEFGMSEGLQSRTRFDYDIETIYYTVGEQCSLNDESRIMDEKEIHMTKV